MRINADTRYFAVEPILRTLSTEKVAEIREKAVSSVLGSNGYYGLTLAQLSKLIDNKDATAIVSTTDPLQMTVFEFYTIEGLSAFLEDYIRKLERLIPTPTNEEKAAQSACLKVTTTEGLLLFAREYFNLNSFANAERVTLAELLIAKKDMYNKAIFQRELSRQMNKRKK